MGLEVEIQTNIDIDVDTDLSHAASYSPAKDLEKQSSMEASWGGPTVQPPWGALAQA